MSLAAIYNEDEYNVEIPEDELKITGFIGEGGFGKVYAGTWSTAKATKEVAIKEVCVTEYLSIHQIRREVEIMARIGHTHICPVYGYCILADTGVWIIMQKADTNLTSYLQSAGTLPTDRILEMFLQLTQNVDYIHSRNPPVLHRDIKPDNVLVINDKLYLADFGLAKEEKNVANSYGTLNFSAPEVLGTTKNWTKKSDIYSLGMVLYHMITGQIPFDDCPQDLVQRLLAGDRPTIPPGCHPDISTLIQLCWDSNPDSRPSSLGLLERLATLLNIDNYWTLNSAALHGVTFVVKDLSRKATSGELQEGLEMAIVGGHCETVQILIERGANIKDKFPLSTAIVNGRAEIVCKLIDYGADVDAFDQDGFTPLMLAAMAGNVDIVRELIHHGADVNKVGALPANEPLYFAISSPNCSTVLGALMRGKGAREALQRLFGFLGDKISVEAAYEPIELTKEEASRTVFRNAAANTKLLLPIAKRMFFKPVQPQIESDEHILESSLSQLLLYPD